ncbi:unnamed protein product [Closterium sp. NIES-53]
MASFRVLAFDHEGCPLQFDTWLDDLTGQHRHFEDLVSHLCASDARYRAALLAEFLDKNPPPMDHFLSLDPTSLTIDLLEQHLLATETNAIAVGAARGTPHTTFFEGCSPSPLAPSYASAAALDNLSTEDVGAASASGKRSSTKGKGGRGGGGGSGSGGGGSSGGSGGGGSSGSGGGSGGVGGGGGGSGGNGGSGSRGSGGGKTGAQRRGSRGGQRQRQQRRSETPSPQQLRERFFHHGASRGSVSCSYGIHTGDRAGQTCEKAHTQHRYFSRLDDTWCAEFGDEAERPHWAELLRSGVAIFDLDDDAILSAMYALSASAEGDCYRCVLPDPRIDAAPLGASESILPGTAPAEALHTFTLDSSASHCFFRDSTTLTPLPTPVPVRLADPSKGPLVAHSTTVLLCLAVPSGSLSGSSLYTLPTEPPHVAASSQVSASGQAAPPCSGRLLSHQTLLWHHRLGHPSLPRLRGMHSRLLVSGLPRSLPPLPPSPAPPCLPCVEGRQRAAPHSSLFPLTTAPLQTLHMDVWGPARVSGQGRERYFLLVVDDYTRYTTVFPLRSKGRVVDVLIPWIRAVRLQLREQFRADLGGPAGASSRLSPQQLCEWLVWRARLRTGATGAGGAGVTTGASGNGARGVGGTGAGGAGASGTDAGGTGVGGTSTGGGGVGGAGAVDPGGAVRPRPYLFPMLQQVLGVPSSTSLPPPLLCPPPNQSQLPLQPASPLCAPSPYTEQSDSP